MHSHIHTLTIRTPYVHTHATRTLHILTHVHCGFGRKSAVARSGTPPLAMRRSNRKKLNKITLLTRYGLRWSYGGGGGDWLLGALYCFNWRVKLCIAISLLSGEVGSWKNCIVSIEEWSYVRLFGAILREGRSLRNFKGRSLSRLSCIFHFRSGRLHYHYLVSMQGS